MVPSWQ
jgi:hypothetical protein